MGQIGWRDVGLQKPILDPLLCVQKENQKYMYLDFAGTTDSIAQDVSTGN